MSNDELMKLAEKNQPPESWHNDDSNGMANDSITQAVELLDDVECSCWYTPPYQRCKQCDARQAFIASYHAEEKEAGK